MKDEVTKSLSDIEFVTFADADSIIGLHEDSSQVMVYGSIDEGSHRDAEIGIRTQSLFVMSALIGVGDFDKYLKEGTYYNYPFGELGNPGIWTDESDEVQFTLGQQREANGVTANYFVRSYRPHGQGRTTFPIVQSFVFYHELTEHTRKYKRLYVDELDDAIVVREEHNPNNEHQKRVIVNKHYLREYLAARKMGLATWTSVRRYAPIVDDFEIPAEVNDGTRRIHVVKADWFGKGRDDKEPIFLHPQTVKALREYLRRSKVKHGALFTSLWGQAKGKRLTTRGLRQIVSDVLYEIGIEKTVHGFRHYFTTTLV